MFKFFENALKSYIVDENEPSLYDRIKFLEDKITLLQEENIEINNCLYEMMNSIEAVDRRIDIIMEPYDINKFTLDK
jgi:hypothetical protein